jgi:hypothetical protein
MGGTVTTGGASDHGVQDRDDLRCAVEMIEELVSLAAEAMRQANTDGGEYDVDDILEPPRVFLSRVRRRLQG